MSIFKISRYPAVLVLALAGVCAIILAYMTLNLFDMTMANIRFLREHGRLAIMLGGLVQFAEIVACAIAALLSYMGFKLCEHDLVRRYQKWQGR